MVALDSYCKANGINEIDFIKIDTEGFEKEVFEGAVDVFRRIKPKFIQMEYNLHQLFRNTPLYHFAAQLTDYNTYQLRRANLGLRKVDPMSSDANIFTFSNFVFIRKDIDDAIAKKNSRGKK